MATANRVLYDPGRHYSVSMRDVACRRDGEQWLLARVYQPEGPGPFPALVDVHGGAWSVGDRAQNELLDRALAAGGLVVVALDFRLAPAHPYPAQVQDVSYGIRWLRAHAAEFNAVPEPMGGLGTSSGGHTLMLAAMRPRDPRYAALSVPEAPTMDAGIAYALQLWAVLDPYARYLYAKETGRQGLVERTEGYFLSEEAMLEGNPQRILERGEPVELPPTLIVQPVPDENIPREIPERFAEAYRAAGGSIELEWFPGAPHGFARTPSPETERAFAVMRGFIARQLAAVPVGP